MKIIQNLDEYNAYFHQETLHPSVAVGELSRADLTLFEPIDFNMYCLANLIKIMINEEYFLQKHAKNENKM